MKRSHTIRSIFISSCIAAFGAIAASANADSYYLTDLGTFIPFDINTYGQMAGNIQIGSGGSAQFTAAFWTPNSANAIAGSLTTLNARHIGEINDYGQMVGVREDGTELGTAFLWTPSSQNGTAGTMTDLGANVSHSRNVSCLTSLGQVAYSTLDLSTSTYTTYIWTPTSPHGTSGSSTPIGDFFAESMNDYGQICGWTYGPGYNAMLWTPNSANATSGTLTPLGTLGGSYVFADTRDINSKGQAVGAVDGFGIPVAAMIWNPSSPNAATGTMANLAPDSTVDLVANGVDESGNAYGALLGSQFLAIMFRNGRVIDLNSTFTTPPAYRLAQAIDANEKGQIIGVMAVGGESHGFLLTPKPVSQQVTDVRQLVTNLVNIGALLPANGQSLYAKLDSAKAKIAAGNKSGAITDLKAFINQVTTFVKTGKLTAAQGQTLIDAANAIIQQLSA